MFCFMCKADSPKVSMKKNGTMVTVKQHCKNCTTGYTWKSQPLVMQTYPAWEYVVELCDIDGRCIDQQNTARFQAFWYAGL